MAREGRKGNAPPIVQRPRSTANTARRMIPGMTRAQQTLLVGIGISLAIIGVLAAAQAGSDGNCALVFPKWVGCVLAAHQALAGGLIAGGGALFAGWLAWSAVRDQDLASRGRAAAGERQTFETLQRELGPLLELWNMIWRIVEETLDFQSDDPTRAGRMQAVRNEIASALPPADVIAHLEDLAEELDPVQRRRFALLASNMRQLHRRIEHFSSERRHAGALQQQLNEFRLLAIQLAQLRAAAIRFDETATHRFAERHPVPLHQDTWATQLEDSYLAAIDEDAREYVRRREPSS